MEQKTYKESDIVRVAEEEGWSVSIDRTEGGVASSFEFSKQSPAGLDFSFSADTINGDEEILMDGMFSYYENFDPDYEAWLWIGDDGHGKNGAPHRIKDIVDDMEEVGRMILDLCESLYDFFNNK